MHGAYQIPADDILKWVNCQRYGNYLVPFVLKLKQQARQVWLAESRNIYYNRKKGNEGSLKRDTLRKL